jgi:hypothetical protein
MVGARTSFSFLDDRNVLIISKKGVLIFLKRSAYFETRNESPLQVEQSNDARLMF